MTTERKRQWWNPMAGWGGSPERRAFEEYQQKGGPLGWRTWIMQGQPRPPITSQPEWLTPRTRGVMGMPEYAEAEAARQVGLPFPGQAGAVPPSTPSTPSGGTKVNIFDTYEEALAAAPAGWEPELTETGQWSFRRVPTKAGKEEMPEGFYKTYKEAAVAAPEGWVPVQTSGGWWGLKQTETDTTQWEQDWQQKQFEWEQQQAAQEQQQFETQMNWYREQAAVEKQEQERQYKSQLLANPMSWLQYSAYTGEQPAIQEWMKPLMSQQYQTGQALPGWQTGQTEGQPMSSLEELRNPSMQYFARMGPTAQQQWMGYQQTRTGATPEESQFRLKSGAPPGGRYGGFRWMR